METPVWLTRAIVETLHAEQLREHGGRPGLKNESLLESALARPQNVHAYEPDSDIAALAAEYGFGLARNHAFNDGNKRIAFAATNVFLILNGLELDAPEPEVVDVVLRLAAGSLTNEQFAEWIRSSMVPWLARD